MVVQILDMNVCLTSKVEKVDAVIAAIQYSQTDTQLWTLRWYIDWNIKVLSWNLKSSRTGEDLALFSFAWCCYHFVSSKMLLLSRSIASTLQGQLWLFICIISVPSFLSLQNPRRLRISSIGNSTESTFVCF